ncbi:MAG TPA: hypothetical protein VF281_02115 [Candidatus Saccharimonadales bacterium]
MKKTRHGLWSGAAVTVVSMAVVFGAVTLTPKVSAHEGHSHTPGMDMSKTDQSTSTTNMGEQSAAAEARRAAEQTAKERHAAARQSIKERQASAKERLDGAKLKACENRQVNINNRSIKITERATKHLAVFDKIAERVNTFYTNKGKTFDTYDLLISEVDAKRSIAQATIDNLSNLKATFDCNEAEPKLAIEAFKTALHEAQSALKEYRMAIKDLIVGVKSANSEDSKNKEETQ